MKKRLISLLILTVVFVPLLVSADTTIVNPLGETETFPQLLAKIAGFIFTMALAVAPLLILYAAFILLNSAGDPEKVQTAKKTIIWTLAGLVIIFLSYAMVNWMKIEVGI